MVTKLGKLFFGGIVLVIGLMGANPHNTAVVTQFSAHIDVSQLKCLAHNIFHEASGESVKGQAAVAWVVLNRVAMGFAKTPCEVVYQTRLVKTTNEDGDPVHIKQCQFSWVCTKQKAIDILNYKKAEQIAYDVFVNNAYAGVIPKSAVFFHSAFIDPQWSYIKVAVIGNHYFYSKSK